MKALSSIATFLIFAVVMFLKVNRLLYVVKETSGESAPYGETASDGFGSYSAASGNSWPVSAGVQSNPFVE